MQILVRWDCQVGSMASVATQFENLKKNVQIVTKSCGSCGMLKFETPLWYANTDMVRLWSGCWVAVVLGSKTEFLSEAFLAQILFVAWLSLFQKKFGAIFFLISVTSWELPLCNHPKLNNHVIQLKFFMIISGGELVCVRSRLQGARRERRLRGAGVRVRPGGRGQGRSCRHHEQLVWIASFPLKNGYFMSLGVPPCLKKD